MASVPLRRLRVRMRTRRLPSWKRAAGTGPADVFMEVEELEAGKRAKCSGDAAAERVVGEVEA
jgi:hypothetical protein